MAVVPVEGDVLAGHEAEVGGPVDSGAILVRARPACPVTAANEAIEVSAQRGIAAAALNGVNKGRIWARREVEVEQTERAERCPARDRLWLPLARSLRLRNCGQS